MVASDLAQLIFGAPSQMPAIIGFAIAGRIRETVEPETAGAVELRPGLEVHVRYINPRPATL